MISKIPILRLISAALPPLRADTRRGHLSKLTQSHALFFLFSHLTFSLLSFPLHKHLPKVERGMHHFIISHQ